MGVIYSCNLMEWRWELSNLKITFKQQACDCVVWVVKGDSQHGERGREGGRGWVRVGSEREERESTYHS